MTNTQWVVRSMSTTDYDWRYPESSVRPFHVYLKPSEERRRAYWATIVDAKRFPTRDDAIQEAKRSLPNWDRVEVVPFDADKRGIPSFWANQEAKNGVWKAGQD